MDRDLLSRAVLRFIEAYLLCNLTVLGFTLSKDIPLTGFVQRYAMFSVFLLGLMSPLLLALLVAEKRERASRRVALTRRRII